MKKYNLKFQRIIFAFTCFLFFCNNTFAQIELEPFFQEAVEKNENLKALHQDYLATLARVEQVNVLPNPEINIGILVPKMNAHMGINRFQIGGMQMFPWFGTLKAKKELVESQAAEKNQNIPIASLEIIFQLKKSWLEIYELEKKKDFLTTNLQLLERLEKATLAKVEIGKTSATKVLLVQLKIEKIKTDLALLENKKKIPQTTFNQLLQRNLNHTIPINTSLEFAKLDFNNNEFTSTIQSAHPMIQKLNTQQKSARNSMKINDLQKRPSFGLGFQWGLNQRYPNVTFDGNGRDMKMAMARVSLPIYKKQYRAKEQEEEQKIIAIEHQKKETVSQFLKKIEQAKSQHEAAEIKLNLVQKQRKITKSAISILETNFSTSGNGFDDLLDLQMDLIEYDQMVLEAIVMSHLAKAKIEKIIIY